MHKCQRVASLPPPPCSALASSSPSTGGKSRVSMADVPDAVLAVAISWLDLDAHLHVCRLSRRFRRLTRLKIATPSSVHLYPTAQTRDLTDRTARAADWLKRAAPAVVTLDIRRAAATVSKRSLDVVDVDDVDTPATAWSQAVASVARTLRLLGSASHAFAFMSEVGRSATLTRLELRVTIAPRDAPRQLPDIIFATPSLRSLTCSGAIAVTSAQVARLTQLTALDLERVARDRQAHGLRSFDGLMDADAEAVATRGQLRHLRLRCAHDRNLRALASTALGARLETLGVPTSDMCAWTDAFPALMPRLTRFATTWLSDAYAAMLAKRAPALTALELRPRSQRVTLRRCCVDGKPSDEEEVARPRRPRHEAEQTHVALGVYEPPAGVGLMRSLARHLPHLRELVLMRHHADLGPLTALVSLTRLVCCDRPDGPTNATRWPTALPALTELRVVDITRHSCDHAAAQMTTATAAATDLNERPDVPDRRRMLLARFPRLAHLRFVRIEDEIEADECLYDSCSVLPSDDYFDAVCRDPDNGCVALAAQRFPVTRADGMCLSSALPVVATADDRRV